MTLECPCGTVHEGLRFTTLVVRKTTARTAPGPDIVAFTEPSTAWCERLAEVHGAKYVLDGEDLAKVNAARAELGGAPIGAAVAM
jgi:hypothetical protein